jgi:hypothetical protein
MARNIKYKHFLLHLLLSFSFVFNSLCLSEAYAQQGKFQDNTQIETLADLKGRLGIVNNLEKNDFVVFPLKLEQETIVTIISDYEFRKLIEPVSHLLLAAYTNFKSNFREIPKFKTVVRLMNEQKFFEYTGAPAWTNALFFRGEMIIPLSTKIDLENLQRSVMHEFTHAIISALSDNKAPGWFDEGLAQRYEGSENPALILALVDWLRYEKPVDFTLLQLGFTKLPSDMVPAAYAQSLFAVNLLIESFGMSAVDSYLEKLRLGYSKHDSFLLAFNLSEKDFEKALADRLTNWATNYQNVSLVQ